MLKYGWAKPVDLGQIDHLGHLPKDASSSGWHLLAQPDQEVMDTEHDSVFGNFIRGHGGAFIESSPGCHLFPNSHSMSFDIPSILFFQPSHKESNKPAQDPSQKAVQRLEQVHLLNQFEEAPWGQMTVAFADLCASKVFKRWREKRMRFHDWLYNAMKLKN